MKKILEEKMVRQKDRREYKIQSSLNEMNVLIKNRELCSPWHSKCVKTCLQQPSYKLCKACLQTVSCQENCILVQLSVDFECKWS